MSIIMRTPEEIAEARWMVRSVSILRGHDSYCEHDYSGFQPYDPEKFGNARSLEVLRYLAWCSAEFRQPRTARLEVYANNKGFDFRSENIDLLISERHFIKVFPQLADKYMRWDNAQCTLREAVRIGNESAKSGVMRTRDALREELDELLRQTQAILDRFLAAENPDAVFRGLFPANFKVVRHWNCDAKRDAIEIVKLRKEPRSFWVISRTKDGKAISVSDFKMVLHCPVNLVSFGFVPAGVDNQDFRNSFYIGTANALDFIKEMEL